MDTDRSPPSYDATDEGRHRDWRPDSVESIAPIGDSNYLDLCECRKEAIDERFVAFYIEIVLCQVLCVEIVLGVPATSNGGSHEVRWDHRFLNREAVGQGGAVEVGPCEDPPSDGVVGSVALGCHIDLAPPSRTTQKA
jgi:hypothetical protein